MHRSLGCVVRGGCLIASGHLSDHCLATKVSSQPLEFFRKTDTGNSDSFERIARTTVSLQRTYTCVPCTGDRLDVRDVFQETRSLSSLSMMEFRLHPPQRSCLQMNMRIS